MSGPLRESDIQFPSAHNSIRSVITELKRDNLSPRNRLRSIVRDAHFVRQNTHGYPLVANERCGSWYIDTKHKEGSAYFKSTDGHFGQWSFSLRRLNTQLFDILYRHHGCVIVDSTRRGKSIPDALSKTIPIWIAVMNRLCFPDVDHELQTPADVVSASEHAQIAEKIDGFVQQASELRLSIHDMRMKLARPMRPYWIAPGMTSIDIDDGSVPVILCTASGRSSVMDADEQYVQGAADDHESWAHGLDADTFWCFRDRLLAANEDELPTLIEQLGALRVHNTRDCTQIRRSQVWISDDVLPDLEGFSAVVHCSPKIQGPPGNNAVLTPQMPCIHLKCGVGKIGSKQLRQELSKIDELRPILAPGHHIICVCPTGKDLAVGVALAVLCKFVDDKGQYTAAEQTVSKDKIKCRLAWIMEEMPDAAPSRATLQSVNAYLMS